MHASVVGAGLAGTEAAMQLAKRGIRVTLYEMKPKRFSPAHFNEDFAELVCSNSFKAQRLSSAAGLLKQEMRILGSVCLCAAEKARVPAGGALAVDRDIFSKEVTKEIKNQENIEICRREVTEIPKDEAVIIAAGPLISDALAKALESRFGSLLSFYDAAAPIVTADSIDFDEAFIQSRYDTGEGDYVNCPMNKQQYENFYEALVNAKTAKLHSFDVYEGCMPIEVLAKRGRDSIRYGPLKPVGLKDPRTAHRPWANLQLRKENAAGTLFNLVGMQTNLIFSEQKRVFSLIPALKNAEFVRYGVMHRNTFLNSPRLLNADFSVKDERKLFFAGQITGVEGYMESAGSGILAGINAANMLLREEPLKLPPVTMLGALSAYICDNTSKEFQPMGAAFGLLSALDEAPKDKKLRYEALAERSLKYLKEKFSAQED
ncbi:MAG TPA: methylenetetrahydrofolate--tRNA-(uracil(54)-C(5))-methyltransferase (FADH(2)-oxidizing) TrmFO [Clostridiales bacterium]|nr:methylenetetrahydrofolate--tRNA-(uracil(54)-C(5))-methyltransferase (FADH(2)-oxidizing) TrmFO [Clostridiales bacterium]